MITSYAYWLKKAPSWLYKAAAQMWIDKKFPRHLFIETTAACNLSCSYCPRERNTDHMDFQLFKQIVDEASGYGPRSFSLHLFGEPMLYPKWFEAVRYIKEKNKKHTVLFTTNGTAINRNIDRLIDSGVDKVLWTWRTEAKFTEETKEKLKAWKPWTVRIIEEITPHGVEAEWPRVEKRSLHNYGGTIELGKFGVQNAPSTKRWPCYHLWLAPAVAWNGNILLCCADPHQKEVIGNVREKTITQAFREMGEVRQSHLRGEFTGICADCDIWKQFPNLFYSWQATGSSSGGAF